MGKGLGKTQAAIASVMTINPDRSFSLDELAAIAYPGLDRIEKKHRVATMRAAERAVREVNWGWRRAEHRGGAALFFNPYNLRSYVHARMRGRIYLHHINKSPAELDRAMDHSARYADNDIRAGHHLPGGLWHRDVARWTAERDKDEVRLSELQDEQAVRAADAERRLAALGPLRR